LANQIAKEAAQLNEFHEFKLCTLVGGVPKYLDAQRLEQGVDLIVSTPGRLIDHLENTNGFAKQVGSLKVFILDEAD
jgi:ATP-dependent RNA helicase DDX18/HAS1